jgi:hypothetical protein
MPSSPKTILGVNPGSRYLGLAVFHGLALVDWRIRVLKGRWSPHKLEKCYLTIRTCMERYRPDALAIKRLHPSRSSVHVRQITDAICSSFKQRGSAVYQYSIKPLEAHFLPDAPLNRRELSARIVSQYPDLMGEFQKEAAAKNPYHVRMFEAVALGALCAHQLDNP